jgi:hypothetical protein
VKVIATIELAQIGRNNFVIILVTDHLHVTRLEVGFKLHGFHLLKDDGEAAFKSGCGWNSSRTNGR